MNEWDKYKGREQSCVKHYVLRSYLQSLTYKLALGIKKPEVVLTYIDGFSGPWKSSTEDLSDTSFQIAINELRKVRDDLSNRKNLKGSQHFSGHFIKRHFLKPVHDSN